MTYHAEDVVDILFCFEGIGEIEIENLGFQLLVDEKFGAELD